MEPSREPLGEDRLPAETLESDPPSEPEPPEALEGFEPLGALGEATGDKLPDGIWLPAELPAELPIMLAEGAVTEELDGETLSEPAIEELPPWLPAALPGRETDGGALAALPAKTEPLPADDAAEALGAEPLLAEPLTQQAAA